MGLFDKAQEKLESVKNTISDIDLADSAKEYGTEKMNEVWDVINNHSKVISEAGYRVNGVNLLLSLTPAIAVEFSRMDIVSDDVEQKLLAENKDHSILIMILKALFKANNMLIDVRSGGFMFKAMIMTIGASIPKVDLKFIRVDE
jgi:hypothetical protein